MQLLPGSPSQSVEYLCDYVYIDQTRLAHYYSQLSDHGLVTQTKKIAKTVAQDSSEVGVKAVLAAGSIRGSSSSEDTLEMQIDSAFSRPQETLDALYEAGYIQNGLSNARMGCLILEKGRISIFDLRLVKDLWPVLGDAFARSQTEGIKNSKDRQKAIVATKKEYEQMAGIMGKLPHALQGTLAVDQCAAWFTLKPECMLLNPDDLTLKHGADLDGDWHVLGIVDALPDHAANPGLLPAVTSNTDIEVFMRTLLSVLRMSFGRPGDRFGLTPIMIFRSIRK